MRGLQFPCDEYNRVPIGPGYNDTRYQACTIKGQRTPGLLSVTGDDFLFDSYGYKTSDLGLNILAVFLMWILVIILNCIAMEVMDLQSGGYTRQVYKKGKAPKIGNGDSSADGSSGANRVGGVVKTKRLHAAGEKAGMERDTTFLWKDIVYTVPVKGGQRRLLDHIAGWIKPGQMTAL